MVPINVKKCMHDTCKMMPTRDGANKHAFLLKCYELDNSLSFTLYEKKRYFIRDALDFETRMMDMK